jgi:hypothetical protein
LKIEVELDDCHERREYISCVGAIGPLHDGGKNVGELVVIDAAVIRSIHHF